MCWYFKWITIPRLELNETLILAQLLSHCKKLLDWLKLLPSKWARNNLLANMTHEEAEELSTTITCTTTCTLAADYKISENPHVKQDLLSQPICWWPRNAESRWETKGQILLQQQTSDHTWLETPTYQATDSFWTHPSPSWWVIVSSSLFCNFHVLGGHRAICSIDRSCVICRRWTPKTTKSQMISTESFIP